MILLDTFGYIDTLKQNGLTATAHKSKTILTILMQYYTHIRGYSINEACKKVIAICDDYFRGIPKEEAVNILSEFGNKNLHEIWKKALIEEPIFIYEREWEVIKSIPDEEERKLAYTSLICAKYVGREVLEDGTIKYHKNIFEHKSEVWKISGINRKTLKGRTQSDLWHSLDSNGYIHFDIHFPRNNNDFPKIYWYVPYRIDQKEDKSNEKVMFEINNNTDIFDYYYYYLGNEGNLYKICSCGAPFRKAQGRRYCSKCAAERVKKRGSEKYKLCKNNSKNDVA